MSKRANKAEVKAEQRRQRAKALYDRLMSVKPMGLSHNDWTTRAGVNQSALNAVRKGSIPSIENLTNLLKAIGLTLPEFFLDEAEGRVIRTPSEEELQHAIREALPGLPSDPGRRMQYLVAVVADVLQLPEGMPVSADNRNDPEHPAPLTDDPTLSSTT